MEISKNLSKQPFSTGSGRITVKNSPRDYFHLLKFPDFRLLVLKCAGSYSQVFTVILDSFHEMDMDVAQHTFIFFPDHTGIYSSLVQVKPTNHPALSFCDLQMIRYV